MAFHHPPRAAQGYYRYDPTALEAQGPARIFPYSGTDGLVRYLLATLGQRWLTEGQLSQPWGLLLETAGTQARSLEQTWYYLTTQLVDLEVFQSGWFNLDLPPDEQFDVPFVKQRRRMMAAVLAAQKATQHLTDPAAARSQFYASLNPFGQAAPLMVSVHQREGGLSDREFARQRLAGQNPMMLRQIQPTDAPWLDTWQPCLDGRSPKRLDLAQAAANQQLFVAEYPLLQQLTPADLQPGRYVGSPVALFQTTTAGGLEPVLIQVEPGRVVLPAPTDEWMQAKLYVQVADVTYHELIVHLADTHLSMEAFAIATPRQLPPNHPLYRLLRPHLRYLLAINTRGNEVLLSPGAAIDNLMAPTREASLALINRAYRATEFGAAALPTNLKQRGVEAGTLADYPYRDDALLLWAAIARYVTQFLTRDYPDDQAVQRDPYLQAWAAELGEPLTQRPASDFPQAPDWVPPHLATAAGLTPELCPAYGRVPGFPAQLTSVQHVIDIATQIIFTCGPQHAAVNFSQFDYVGYVPNGPLAAYAAPGTCDGAEHLLPTVAKDVAQMELAYALSGIRWGKLGCGEAMQFRDRGDRAILKHFQADLAGIEDQIRDRNRQRQRRDGVPYPYLLPSQIPNTINI